MKLFALWSVLFYKNIIVRCQYLFYKLRVISYRAHCLLFRYIDYRIIFVLSHISRFLGLTCRDVKLRAAVAQSNRQCLLNDNKKFDYIWLTQRRQLLIKAVTYGQNRSALQELSACSTKLNEVVEPLQREGQPVILAPLHMVSDVLGTMVGAGVFPGKATVITSRSADMHSEAERQMGGVDLMYCSIHEDSKNIAEKLMASVMEAVEIKRNIILFPDITPDFTHFANKAKAEKLSCRIFDRPANLHSGIIRLARMMSAKVVFYHLYYDKGLHIYIHEPVSAKKLKNEMPRIIEKSIREYSTDWMLWHSHSLFFINE
ncbi:ABC transporter [Ewingella americana]|nr:ABC transporter [Ewingella americana]